MAEAQSITHPYLKEGIEPRLFQQTILSTCINKNTLVVLPTGTGKTMISILHIAYLLQNEEINGDGNYVLIMAPTKPLVHQHKKSLENFLNIPENKIVELSGAIAPAKRKGLIANAWIIIATPQTIRNDIIHNYLDSAKCKLVYFDEAHRARGDYDYVHIADILYKFNPDTRIIALTASPGSNREDILEICTNLFIEEIESRTKEDPEVNQYVQEVEVEKIEVPLPLEFEEILKIINKLGEREVAFLREKGYTQKTFSFLYKGELLSIKKQLSTNFRANYLEIMACNRLIYIQLLRETLESQGIPSTQSLIEGWKEKNSKSIRGLFNVTDFRMMVENIQTLNNQGIIHPKLLYLLDILDTVDLINSRVLIFCNLRATCYAISEALVTRGFDAKAFVGQSRGKSDGLSQKKQIAILDAFRKDKFSILVSTSVLEEGLDVDECNLVIFYDSTASAIRKIQRAGRTGRKKKGQVIVLTTHHTIDTTAHFISNARERKMNQLLYDITWLKRELRKKAKKDTRAFAPENKEKTEQMNKGTISDLEDNEENTDENEMKVDETNEKLSSFKVALEDAKKWGKEENEKKKKNEQVKIIVDSREKNSKILFYLKKEGIDLDFKQLESGDYILSDRVVIEYKKGEDLLSSIIDGRLFEQLGSLTNAYQIPVLLIEGFPSGGIHPEAIAGALASFMIDFGVSVIQTQNSEESAAILRRLAIREQKTKKRRALIRRGIRISNPKQNSIQVISSFPGINRTLATRLLDTFGSIKNIINSNEEEMAEIEGIGPIKSKKFLDLANQEFD